MQNDIFINKAAGSVVSTRNPNAQNRSLQDELMQELVQHKTSLEKLTTVDVVESNSQANGGKMSSELSAAPAANTLRSCVEQTMHNYFAQLDGQVVTNVYEMVLSEVEAPLLEVVMRNAMGNQCKAAELLGLSRGTLRKKLQQYGML